MCCPGFPEDSLGKIPHFLFCALNEWGCSASLSQMRPPLVTSIYLKKLITTFFFLKEKMKKQNKKKPQKATTKHLLSNNWDSETTLKNAERCQTLPYSKGEEKQILSFVFHMGWNSSLWAFCLGFDTYEIKSFCLPGFSGWGLLLFWMKPENNCSEQKHFLLPLPWGSSCFKRNKHEMKWK